jgi:hypothetical protein
VYYAHDEVVRHDRFDEFDNGSSQCLRAIQRSLLCNMEAYFARSHDISRNKEKRQLLQDTARKRLDWRKAMVISRGLMDFRKWMRRYGLSQKQRQ